MRRLVFCGEAALAYTRIQADFGEVLHERREQKVVQDRFVKVLFKPLQHNVRLKNAQTSACRAPTRL